jgi:hypothetical protein
MTTIQIKWGLGMLMRPRRPIKLYHVVVDGLTRASFVSEDDAKAWVNNYMKTHPFQRHDLS